MLLGLVYATSGEIEVLGRRESPGRPEVLPQIGALIEEPAAYPHLSGRANLALLDAAGPRVRAAGPAACGWTQALEQVGLARGRPPASQGLLAGHAAAPRPGRGADPPCRGCSSWTSRATGLTPAGSGDLRSS